MAALSTNALAIALGALFDPETVKSPTAIAQYAPPSTPTHFFLPLKPNDVQLFNSSEIFRAETIGLNASLSCEALNALVKVENNTFKAGTVEIKNEVGNLRFRTTAYEDSGPLCEGSAKFEFRSLSNDGSITGIERGYNGSVAMEAYAQLKAASDNTRENEICGGLFPVIFSRTQPLSASNSFRFDPTTFRHKSIVCRPKLDVHRYEITFDTSGRIIRTAISENSADEKPRVFAGPITESQLLARMQLLLRSDLGDYSLNINAESGSRLYFSDNPLPRGWIDFMLQTIFSSTEAIDPQTPIQDIDINLIGEQLNVVYARVFSVALGIYHSRMFTRASPSAPQTEGVKFAPTVRVQISTSMFALTTTLLGFYFILAIYFYLFRVSRLFQRLPTSIASEIQLFHKSSVLDDVRGTELLTGRQRKAHLSRLNRRYGYGRFVGRDSILRVGIEREPLLDHMLNQEVRNQGLGKFGLTIEYWAQWLKKTLN
ncbi:hypothetical protein TWF506_008364 [Arthrobotrys conoides]|uniref:Uncharacterized protein n=1 Tax=Arthrobotrys conoides TaxID=74498 RepID=A0AAN8RS12_9PEZI